MKKYLFIFIVFLAACAPKTADIILPDGFIVKAELAITPEELEKGLMFRTELAQNGGMLFVFDTDEPRYFWMKNTLIDLDILFINSDQKVFSHQANVPHSYVYTPDNQVAVAAGFGKYVLELPAGSIKKHGIKDGSLLEFNLR